MKLQAVLGVWAALCLAGGAAEAQTYVSDALQFSGSRISGTARFQSMGGVGTALGADLSSISGNPAGLGLYRKSEWSVTPSLTFTNNTGTFINRQLNDGTTFFNVPNFGIVFSGAKSDNQRGEWRGGSFGISYNQMLSFRNESSFQGNPNNANSLAIYFRNLADDLNVSGNELDVPDNQIGFNVGFNTAMAQLAYKGYLIDGYDSDRDGNQDVGNYYQTTLSRNATVDPQTGLLREDPFRVAQSETWSTTGNRRQWSFAWGGNWADKLYVGASVGVSSIRYESKRGYTEAVQQSTLNFLDRFTVTDNLNIRGTGANATLGLVYRPADVVRVGLSFTTPTIHRMSETSFTSVTTLLRNPGNLDNPVTARTVETDFNYNLITPMRGSLGVAFFVGKHGFVSGDVEYAPYQAIRIGGNDWNTNSQGINERISLNNDIKTTYRNTFNYRVGAEFRHQILRLRAGGAYFSDPYRSGFDKLDRSSLAVTGGVGVKINAFYADLGLVNSRQRGGYTPYQLDNAPSATVQYRTTSVLLTIGSSF